MTLSLGRRYRRILLGLLGRHQSMPGTPLAPMMNVRVFRAQLAVAFLRLFIACGFLPIYFPPDT